MVTILTRNTFDIPQIPGEMHDIVAALNIASSNGNRFVTFTDKNDKLVAIQMSNITLMREEDDDESFIGR